MKITSTLRVFTLIAACALAASAADISRDDLKKVLDDNPDLVLDVLSKNPKKFMDTIRKASQQEQELAAKDELDQAFKNPMEAEIGSHAHVRGKKSAKYTLVEYSDFQCPYCGRGFRTVEDLRTKYGSDLRFIYKNEPLPMHPEAMPAAKYFEAIAMQSPDKAWKFHDTMFGNQQKLSDDFFKETAKGLGVDMDKLAKDVDSQEVKDRIAADQKEAEKFGFNGTPGFLLNGIPVRGAYPVDYFDQIIARLDQDKKGK